MIRHTTGPSPTPQSNTQANVSELFQTAHSGLQYFLPRGMATNTPELQSRRHVLLPNNYLTDGHPTIRADREWLEYLSVTQASSGLAITYTKGDAVIT